MRTPDCAQAQLYLDGRLDPPAAQAFEAHLATCADCQALVKSWQAFATKYRAETVVAPPNGIQEQRFAAKVRALGNEKPRRFSWVFVAAPVMALILLVPLVVQLLSGGEGPFPTSLPVVALEGSVNADAIESGAARPSRVKIGDDRVGVGPAAKVRIARHDQKQVRLELDRGAVAAQVKHREQGQSFVVSAGKVEVTVVGTQFRVARTGDAVRVDVIEGHVKVKSGDQNYDVLRGQSLDLDATGVHPGAFSDATFSELTDPPPPAPVVEDAGTAVEPPDAINDEPPPGVAPVPPQIVQSWRRSAMQGKCGMLLPTLHARAADHPRQAEVWAVLADCQRILGHDRDAVTAYRRVVTSGSVEEADHARMLLASLLLDKLDDAPGAAEVLRASLKHRQPPALEAAARVKLAKALLAQDKKTEARAELQRVVKSFPESPAAPEALELLKRLGK